MKHIFGITNLGSGSSGNATVIHGPEGNLLLDAGFSAKELALRMAGAGIEPESIQGILISHGHSDHTKGCRVFSQRYNVPVYTTSVTGKSLYKKIRFRRKSRFLLPAAGLNFAVSALNRSRFPMMQKILSHLFSGVWTTKSQWQRIWGLSTR